jgi:tetratricopeptide (TPR) repeat protein
MSNESRLQYGWLTSRISNLIGWLSQVERERVTLLIAALALSMGAIQPWYKLPPETLKAFDASLSITNLGRVLAALFACLSFAFAFRFDANRPPRLAYLGGAIATILFPYFISTWSPSIDYIASSIYAQEARITAHVKINFNQVQAQWKQNVQLSISNPLTSTFDLSIGNARFFQVSSWDRIWLSGFGYSRPFLAFIGRGWMMTGVGFGFGAIAIYLGLREAAFPIFLRDMSRLLPWLGLLLSVLVFSMILPSIINYQLDEMFARGEYHQVLSTSRTLASFYRPMRSDEGFLKRMAEASFYGNEPDSALINFAKGLERYRQKDLAQAENYFQRSLDNDPSRSVVRGYLATTILNQAVKYYNTSYNTNAPNTRKPGAAIDRMERVLQIFPGHIEAMYDLMLARAANGEFKPSAQIAREIIAAERYAQLPNLSLLGQAYLHSAWSTYRDGDPALAWQKFRQSTDASTWNGLEEDGDE